MKGKPRSSRYRSLTVSKIPNLQHRGPPSGFGRHSLAGVFLCLHLNVRLELFGKFPLLFTSEPERFQAA